MILLFFKGGVGSGFRHHRGRPGQRGGSVTTASRLELIEQTLRNQAAPWRHLDYSVQAWDREFPDGAVTTPLGRVSMGKAQPGKLISKQRERYFGLIRPTMEMPTFIVSELETPDKIKERVASGQSVERPAVIKFIRAFLDEHGRYHGFMSVTISKDGMEIAVSSSPRKLKQIARAVEEGAILAGSTVAGEVASPGSEDSLNKATSYQQYTFYRAKDNSLGVIAIRRF